MRLQTALRLVLLFIAYGAAPLLAAPVPLPPAGSVPIAQAPPGAPALDDLLTLPGERVTVRYPPETLDRATRVQARLEAIDRLWASFAPQPLGWSATILRRAEWESAGLGGWGAPQRIGPGQFLVPAEGDAGTVAFARSLSGGVLPDPGGDPLTGTREEAGSLIVADLLLEIEAARALAGAAPLSGDAPWVTGVLIQLAVRYAWERAEPEQMLGYVAIVDAISAAQGGPRARRLDDYRGGLPFETELWYQAQFVRGADAIWVEAGWMGTARRLDKWRRKGVPVTAAELEKKYPALALWKRDAFAP